MNRHPRITAAIASAVIIGAPLTGLVFASSASATGPGYGHTPVTICHNGHTITVDDNGLKGHLAHGDSLGECAPVVTPEPTPPVVTPPVTEPPVTEPPVTEPPVTEPPVVTPEPTPPVEPPVVVTPPPAPVFYVQDFIDCLGGRFVLDNTGNAIDATYVAQGVTYLVPAGTAIHTDADGTLLQPLDGTYTITAGDSTWTFPSSGNCPTTPPTTTEPTTPPVVVPPTDEPTEQPSVPVTPPSTSTPSAPGSEPVPTTAPEPGSASPSLESSAPPAATTASAAALTTSPDEQRADALAYTGARDLTAWVAIAAVAIAAGFAAIVVPILRRRQRANS